MLEIICFWQLSKTIPAEGLEKLDSPELESEVGVWAHRRSFSMQRREKSITKNVPKIRSLASARTEELAGRRRR
jgi:hypothetical protein